MPTHDEGELTSDERALLARAYADATPPEDLEERTVAALRRRGMLGRSSSRAPRYAATMKQAAAAVLLFTAGIVVGQSGLLRRERSVVREPTVAAKTSTATSPLVDSAGVIRTATGPAVRRVVWF
jgi:hypothetical protein